MGGTRWGHDLHGVAEEAAEVVAQDLPKALLEPLTLS